MVKIHLEKTGIRPGTVNELYHGIAKSIKFDHIVKICDALECSLDELMEYDPKDKKQPPQK